MKENYFGTPRRVVIGGKGGKNSVLLLFFSFFAAPQHMEFPGPRVRSEPPRQQYQILNPLCWVKPASWHGRDALDNHHTTAETPKIQLLKGIRWYNNMDKSHTYNVEDRHQTQKNTYHNYLHKIQKQTILEVRLTVTFREKSRNNRMNPRGMFWYLPLPWW